MKAMLTMLAFEKAKPAVGFFLFQDGTFNLAEYARLNEGLEEVNNVDSTLSKSSMTGKPSRLIGRK